MSFPNAMTFNVQNKFSLRYCWMLLSPISYRQILLYYILQTKLEETKNIFINTFVLVGFLITQGIKYKSAILS